MKFEILELQLEKGHLLCECAWRDLMDDKHKQFQDLTQHFDIPVRRRDTTKLGNLMWLSRNMGIRNSNRENALEARKLLRELVKDSLRGRSPAENR